MYRLMTKHKGVSIEEQAIVIRKVFEYLLLWPSVYFHAASQTFVTNNAEAANAWNKFWS